MSEKPANTIRARAVPQTVDKAAIAQYFGVEPDQVSFAKETGDPNSKCHITVTLPSEAGAKRYVGQKGITINGEQIGEIDNDFLGITVLSSHQDATVDMVAIHGLNGHGFGTWEINGAMWLRDFLPDRFPGARIMTFGYDSSIRSKDAVSGIRDFANQLLRMLHGKRTSNQGNESNRPIIFLCHSLGGIVLKRALLLADNENRFHSIRDSTIAICFFGCPHSGSDVAEYGKIMGFMASLCNVREDLVKGLVRNSKELLDLANDFRKFYDRPVAGKELKILTFYETRKLEVKTPKRFGLKTKILHSMIVPMESAVLNIGSREEQNSMNKNHSTLCKFSHPADEDYETVVTSLRSIIEQHATPVDAPGKDNPLEAQGEEWNKKFKKCMKAMSTFDPSDDIENIRGIKGARTATTCEWILETEEYSSWEESQISTLLWIHGSPGIGKTFVGTFLVEYLQKNASKPNMNQPIFYFCSGREKYRNTAVAVMNGLLRQLLKRNKAFFSHMVANFCDIGPSILEKFTFLKQVMEAVLAVSSLSDTCFLIDGVDECDDESVRLLLGALVGILREAKIKNNRIKFIILSRDIPSIRSQIGGYTSLALQITSDTVRNDVKAFISSSVDELLGSRGSTTMKDTINKILDDRADGTFLWVSLALRELQNSGLSSFESIMTGMPEGNEGLSGFYEQMLRRISPTSKDMIRAILHFIAVAMRPLTLAELATAYYVRMSMARQPFHPDVSTLSDQIKLIQEQLLYDFNAIEVKNGRVHVIHESFIDYLSSNSAKSIGFVLDSEDTNGIFSSVCLKYLEEVEIHAEHNWESFQQNGLNVEEVSPASRNSNGLCDDCGSHLESIYYFQDIQPLDQRQCAVEHIRQRFLRNPFLEYSSAYMPHHIRKVVARPLDRYINFESDFWKTHSVRRSCWFQMYIISHTGGIGQTRRQWTPLHIAGYLGLTNLAETLLGLRGTGELRTADWHGETPLCIAVSECQAELVTIFCTHGADQTVTNEIGLSLIEISIFNGDNPTFDFLTRSTPPSLMVSEDGSTPLHFAAERDNGHFIRKLLEKGLLVDDQDHKGDTPLHRAVSVGGLSAVTAILENSPNLGLLGSEGLNSLDLALSRNETIIFEQLLLLFFHNSSSKIPQNNQKTKTERDTNFYQCPSYESIYCCLGEQGVKSEVVSVVLRNYSVPRETMDALLFHAVTRRKTDLLQILLDGGCHVDTEFPDGHTPLSLATLQGNLPMAKLLVDGYSAKVDFISIWDGIIADIRRSGVSGSTDSPSKVAVFYYLLKRLMYSDSTSEEGLKLNNIKKAFELLKHACSDDLRYMVDKRTYLTAQSKTHSVASSENGLTMMDQSDSKPLPVDSASTLSPESVIGTSDIESVATSLHLLKRILLLDNNSQTLVHIDSLSLDLFFGLCLLNDNNYNKISVFVVTDIIRLRREVSSKDYNPPFWQRSRLQNIFREILGGRELLDSSALHPLQHEDLMNLAQDISMSVLELGCSPILATMIEIWTSRGHLIAAQGMTALLNKSSETEVLISVRSNAGHGCDHRMSTSDNFGFASIHLDKNLNTPLHLAMGPCIKPWVVETLLDNGADFKAKNESQQTPLHIGAKEIRSGGSQLVKLQLLLEHAESFDFSREAPGPINPFSKATSFNSFLNTPDKDGNSALAMMTSYRFLMQHLDTRSFYAENLAHLPGITFERNRLMTILLKEACFFGEFELAEFALQYGAAINDLGHDGAGLPLFLVSRDFHTNPTGYGALMSLLLDRGANIKQRDTFGNTALHWAISGVTASPLKGASLSFPKRHPSTILSQESHDQDIVVKLLLERGADINAQNADGDTPLHLCCCIEEGNISIIETLLNHPDTQHNIKNAKGRTPYNHFASCGFPPLLKVLLTHSAIDTTTTDNFARNAIFNFILGTKKSYSFCSISWRETLFNPEARDYLGLSMLSWAMIEDNVEAARLVLWYESTETDLTRSFDPLLQDLKSMDGMSPLYYEDDILEMVSSRRQKISELREVICNYDGKPLHCFIAMGCRKIIASEVLYRTFCSGSNMDPDFWNSLYPIKDMECAVSQVLAERHRRSRDGVVGESVQVATTPLPAGWWRSSTFSPTFFKMFGAFANSKIITFYYSVALLFVYYYALLFSHYDYFVIFIITTIIITISIILFY